MRGVLTIALLGTFAAVFIAPAVAQNDWYQQREERYRGDQWRPHLFEHVRTDLEHVWTGIAKDKELVRLNKTEAELTKMQSDLDETRWDNGLLNDVIDSISKTANDDRIQARDRAILADDVQRLKDFQRMHHGK